MSWIVRWTAFIALWVVALPLAAREALEQRRWESVDALLAEVAPDARLAREGGPGRDGVAGDAFGGGVALSGDTLAVGAPGDAVARFGSLGSVYLFVREAAGWRLDTKLLPPGNVAQGSFGARLALEGGTLLVGVPALDAGGGAPLPGRVHVYTRSGASWQFETTLQPADGGVGDRFGHALVLSGDTALIAGPGASSGGIAGFGAVWVYQRAGATWTAQARLAPADAAANSSFGSGLALDGDRVLIGANGSAPSGAGYVFERVAGTWAERSKLVPAGAQPSANVGLSVALSGDTAVLGAPLERAGDTGPQGRAYVFRRGVSQWAQEAVLSNASGGPGDQFGFALAASGDHLAISRPAATLGTSVAQGAVDLWQRVAGSWTPVRSVTAGADGSEGFGRSLIIDGTRMVIGIPVGNTAPTTSGAVHVYEDFDAPAAEPVVLGAGPGPSGRMGSAVAIDGDTLVVGAPFESAENRSLAGAAYVFGRSGGLWGLRQRLVSPDVRREAQFGSAVAIAGDTLVVGAPGDVGQPGAGGSFRGNAWVFVRSAGTWILQARLASPVGADVEFFGSALAIEGDTLAVGIPNAVVGNESSQGAVEVFTRSGSNWSTGGRLVAGEFQILAQFGGALALDGNRLAVASIRAGLVQVFERTGGNWNPTARIATSTPGDGFGWSLDLAGDRLLVGAPFRALGGAAARGGADFHELRSGTWVLRSQQAAPDGMAQDAFGWSVALVGNTALVGSFPTAGGPPRPADAVHVFEWRGSNWRLDRRWRPSDLTLGEEFGSALAFDGTTAVVGAPKVSGAAPWGNPEEGVAYVFTHVADLLFFDDLESDAAPARDP